MLAIIFVQGTIVIVWYLLVYKIAMTLYCCISISCSGSCPFLISTDNRKLMLLPIL